MITRLRPFVLYVAGLSQLILVLVCTCIILERNRISSESRLPAAVINHSPFQAALIQPEFVRKDITMSFNDTGLNQAQNNMTGKVNYDVWHWIIGYTVDDMRIKRSFPNHPDDRRTTDTLRIEFSEKDPTDKRGKYAHKIYGYLLVHEKGEYTFKVKMSGLTAACTVELWISNDTDPMNMQKVLRLEYPEVVLWWRSILPTVKSNTSAPIAMEERKYYFEFLEKAYDGRCIVDIMWKPPSSGSFSPIPSSDFAMAANFDAEGRLLDSSIAEVLQGPLPSNTLQDHHHVQFIGDTIYPITDLDVLPKCAECLYPKRLSGITMTDVYPSDKPKLQMTYIQSLVFNKGPNAVVPQDKVEEVLATYTKALNASKKYTVKDVRLHSLERTKIRKKGFRFLLELDIELEDETVHTSEYVLLPNDGSGLCHTANFQWNKHVDVHFVVTLKNLRLWAIHLIHNFEYIYSQTQDEHFSLVIVDYDSQDIDIEAELRNSTLKRWHVIKLYGDFIKTVAFQAGIDYIHDPDSIIMTLDLHLTLPVGFIEYTRRHVVQNSTAFAPMVFRLEAGYTELNLWGFYEIWGTGLLAMYKSDFVLFGAFRGMKNSTKWGGEDWKLLDKAVDFGYEVYRLRCPGLVHYYHTKAGMWDNKN